MRHLLVTNDFPPKVGGIQSYLGELWRRLPPGEATVLTTRSADGAFDARQVFRIERTVEAVLLPTPGLGRRVTALADEVGAALVLFDPVMPVGMLGPRLGRRYGVVVHGAELVVPARLPGGRQLAGRVLGGAAVVVAAGAYVAAEAERASGRHLPVHVVPPGVDVERFVPLPPDRRQAVRAAAGLPVDGRLVLSVSRLVPRKGMDTLIAACARVAAERPDLTLAIAGAGRDRHRLERLGNASGARVRFLGQVDDSRLPELYGCADVFAMLCRNRWGGLEQEGFGIVFLEAAACGLPQVAGDSGGAGDAVMDGQTGFVLRQPTDAAAAAAVLGRLLDDPALRRAQGVAARRMAEERFSYDHLAAALRAALESAA